MNQGNVSTITQRIPGIGRSFHNGIRDWRFYRAARPRIERLTSTFGGLSLFLSKYIYGLRWAACIFYGVARMPYEFTDAALLVGHFRRDVRFGGDESG